MPTDIEAVLRSLTLEEKISLLAGKDFWETVPIPAKGVPSIKTSDGPNGARGADFTGSVTAACFPAASCMAATFNPELAFRVGQAIAEETRTKGARCILAPTTCIHRHPLGGRNFESFSEDPFHAGKMTAQVINGIQSLGVAATIKHFAANEQETDRFTVDETVDERALREIYLRPFEIAIKESNPWAVMTAYNSLNGHHCDSNEFLLKKVLRGDWGWKGLVMSDWGGTNSTVEAINAGLDLEMPGPAGKRKTADVVAAVERGQVLESTIDERARNVLELLEKLKAFEDPTIPPEKAVNKAEHRALIREAGSRGAVLLKNDNQVLPLDREKVKGKKIAVIGLAKTALAHGGGSASVAAHYKVTPWEALQTALGDSAELVYAEGAHTARILPPLKAGDNVGTVIGLDGKPGFTLTWLDSDTGKAVEVKHGREEAKVVPLLSAEGVGQVADFQGDFSPAETGSHYLACTGFGPTQVFVNDELVYEQKEACPDPMGFIFGAHSEHEFTYPFKAGSTYRVRVRSDPPSSLAGMELLAGRTAFRLGLETASSHDADLAKEAAAIARDAAYAIIFTGHDPQWETEGQDQASFHLPRNGSQDELISAVAAVNPNTVVVNSTGVAVAMPWLGQVAGLVQAWFPGQESGNSIVDVLTGVVNPEGRLPASFPRRLEDAPAHGNFPGIKDGNDGQRRVTYAEGVFVGYRHYDRLGRDALNFPFGFGLSYTTFAFGDLSIDRLSDGQYRATVEVTNTGAVAGATLAQIYAGRRRGAGDGDGSGDEQQQHPAKALVAFAKTRLLAPGEAERLELPVAARDCGFFDVGAQQWVVPAGPCDFTLAESAGDPPLQTVTLSLESRKRGYPDAFE